MGSMQSNGYRMRASIFHQGPARGQMDALDMLRAKKLAKKMQEEAADFKAAADHMSA